MSSNRSRKHSESHADKLRELLNASDSSGQTRQNQSSNDHLRYKHDPNETPPMEDLVRLIQTVENVNQQILFENKYLKEEMIKSKAAILKLVEENTFLYKEQKNITVHEILAEFNNVNQPISSESGEHQTLQNQLKNKDEELHQSQILINELQKRLDAAQSTTKNKRSTGASLGETGGQTNTSLDNIDTNFNLCSKCSQEMEIKIRQIENLKSEKEHLNKSNEYLKIKLDEYEMRENDLLAQIKKHIDLVKHLEMEKNQAYNERDQFRNDKTNSEQKLEQILEELNNKISKEKESVVNNFETQFKSLNEQNQILEQRCFKQESLIDRLERDKVSLTSELESYKKKCNSIDYDTHQMAEKLRSRYLDVLKERDVSLQETKRIRHDYDLYVKQNDQDKFCLRNELNTTRTRLMELEKDLLSSREECIQLNEKINGLDAELIQAKHAKTAVENSRNENLKALNEKFEQREAELVNGIEALQARYCITVKELEELIEKQKKLLTQLKQECKMLNEQLEVIAIKYKNDTSHLNQQVDESNTRLSKYEKRMIEFEEQNLKHNDLHERMKERLKQMTMEMEEKNEILHKTQSNETLMKSTNMQLIKELNMIKQNMSMFTMPTKIDEKRHYSNLSEMGGGNTALNTVRSAIENTFHSFKSK